MSRCNPKILVQLLDKQLRLNAKLQILDHLDGCEACRAAMYHLTRDRDKSLFIYKDYTRKRTRKA